MHGRSRSSLLEIIAGLLQSFCLSPALPGSPRGGMALSAPPVTDSGPSSTLVVVTGAARTIGLPRVHRSLATHVIAALGGAPAVDVCMTLFVQNAASAWKPSAILGDDCPDAASISAGIGALSPRWLHVLASGDCASYATLPGAVLPCHNSSSWRFFEGRRGHFQRL